MQKLMPLSPGFFATDIEIDYLQPVVVGDHVRMQGRRLLSMYPQGDTCRGAARSSPGSRRSSTSVLETGRAHTRGNVISTYRHPSKSE